MKFHVSFNNKTDDQNDNIGKAEMRLLILNRPDRRTPPPCLQKMIQAGWLVEFQAENFLILFGDIYVLKDSQQLDNVKENPELLRAGFPKAFIKQNIEADITLIVRSRQR